MAARALALVFLCGFATVALAEDQLPKLTAETLSGDHISLPGDTKVAAYILSFGFSHKSDKAVAAWDKLIAPKYTTESRVAYYEIPVMEGLPGLVKPMVLHGMRKVIPRPEQARFAPIYSDEMALKGIVGFSKPEAAYVVVATPEGKVVWNSHTSASDAELQELERAVAALLK
jgi:hypothetical protein